jgi:hypothetical protein
LAASAGQQRIAVTMETSKTWAPISPYFYGQFIEHICYSAREILEVTARLQNGTAG